MWQPSDDGRRRYRRWTPLAANLSMNGERHPVLVRDISPGGACVLAEAAAKLREAADVLLEISDFGTVPAQIARRNGNEVGLRFEQKAEEANAIVDWLTPIRSAMH
jgi:hypothetical protein